MTRAIDYRQVSAFWNDAASAGGSDPDCAAALSAGRITPAAHSYCRRGQLDQFVDMIGVPAPGSTVLDLGCGPGLFSLEISASVASIHGIDLAQAFVEAARTEASRRGVKHARFEVGSVVDGIPEGPFSLVILSGVLPYVGDDDLRRVLAGIGRAAAPEGLVYVRVSCATRVAWQRSGRYAAIYRSRHSYEQEFRSAGFDVVRQEPDRFYTYYDLLMAYLALFRAATLGVSRRRSNWEDAFLHAIVRGEPGTLEIPRRILTLLPTPLPSSHSFLLRLAR